MISNRLLSHQNGPRKRDLSAQQPPIVLAGHTSPYEGTDSERAASGPLAVF